MTNLEASNLVQLLNNSNKQWQSISGNSFSNKNNHRKNFTYSIRIIKAW